MYAFVEAYWPVILTGIQIALSFGVSAHAVLTKLDARSAIAWVGIAWLVPALGIVLYVLFGINRIGRRATRLRIADAHRPDPLSLVGATPEDIAAALPEGAKHLAALADLTGRLTALPLAQGNRITPLINGDEAYPTMIEAIDGATRSVALSTYIFDNDATGRRIADALDRAVERGVAVRVLIDGVGARYSTPSMVDELRARGITTMTFLPTLWSVRMAFINLRNHRKILVLDGRRAFTGGLNIREGCVLEAGTDHPVQDVHFRVEGPVVAEIMDVFAVDWAFAAYEPLTGEDWYPALEPAGDVLARGIAGGPDEDFGKGYMTLLGAIGAAHRSIRVVTPYFLPDGTLITALTLAALRGVQVEIVLPAEVNLKPVEWACWAQLRHVLRPGISVYLTPPPFDHSKLMVVDGAWCFFGSTNWDPRSYRLNFEFNVEAYSSTLAGEMNRLVDEKIAHARLVGRDDLRRRGPFAKLRDGAAWLMSPYL